MQTLQQQMMGDAEIMEIIEPLQNDPDFLAIMQNPEIMTAVQDGDFKTLETNPKMMKLMEKSQVKAIKRKETQHQNRHIPGNKTILPDVCFQINSTHWRCFFQNTMLHKTA